MSEYKNCLIIDNGKKVIVMFPDKTSETFRNMKEAKQAIDEI